MSLIHSGLNLSGIQPVLKLFVFNALYTQFHFHRLYKKQQRICRSLSPYVIAHFRVTELCVSAYVTAQQANPVFHRDHLLSGIMKIVIRSSGSSAAMIGDPGRLAPQLLSGTPATKNIRCGCQALPLIVQVLLLRHHVGHRRRPSGGSSLLSSVDSTARPISALDFPASTHFVFNTISAP